jgi:succinate dehydrogenase / fumarate reductase, cytochrome b subunit
MTAAAPAERDATADSGSPTFPRASLGRRLFAISGILPLGVFLVEHIVTNASALAGQVAFDRVVGTLQRAKAAWVVEVLFVFVPLAFHAAYGTWRALRAPGRGDAASLGYASSGYLLLQRLSAVVMLLFIALHLWEIRVQRWLFGLGIDAVYTRLVEHMSTTAFGVPWFALGYVFGIAAAVFHLANGVIALRLSHGATKRETLRRDATIIGALGVLLFVCGTGTVIALAGGGRLVAPAESETPCGSAAAGASSGAPAPSAAPSSSSR